MLITFKREYLLGAGIAAVVLILDFLYLLRTRWFFSVLIVVVLIAGLQPLLDFLKELNRQKDIEKKFLEFVRNLVGTVKSGVSIPQAIINVGDADYGSLSPYLKKLKNQIEWGIPIQSALQTFAKDTKNVVIKRSVGIVIEAEKGGGDIESVLDSVSESVVNLKKMKEERKASTHSQIVQGYIVFYVFIGIMLVLQLWLFPLLSQSTGGGFSLGDVGIGSGVVGEGSSEANLDRVFLNLIMIQGFFTGLVVGKFSEGTLKQGLIHSVVLIVSALLIITTAKGGL